MSEMHGAVLVEHVHRSTRIVQERTRIIAPDGGQTTLPMCTTHNQPVGMVDDIEFICTGCFREKTPL